MGGRSTSVTRAANNPTHLYFKPFAGREHSPSAAGRTQDCRRLTCFPFTSPNLVSDCSGDLLHSVLYSDIGVSRARTAARGGRLQFHLQGCSGSITLREGPTVVRGRGDRDVYWCHSVGKPDDGVCRTARGGRLSLHLDARNNHSPVRSPSCPCPGRGQRAGQKYVLLRAGVCKLRWMGAQHLPACFRVCGPSRCEATRSFPSRSVS